MPHLPENRHEATLHFAQETAIKDSNCVFGLAGGINSTSANADLVAAAWLTNMAPVICDAVTLLWVEVVDSTGAFTHLDVNETGSLAVPCVSPAVAIFVHKSTGKIGHAHRGRMYHPGAPEAQVNAGGRLADEYREDVNTALTGFFDQLAAGDGEMYLLHSESSALAPDLVTALVADQYVGTQRRRQR